MSKYMNLTGVHDNGNAELQIGIRTNSFVIKRDNVNTNKIKFVDNKTGDALNSVEFRVDDNEETLIIST